MSDLKEEFIKEYESLCKKHKMYIDIDTISDDLYIDDTDFLFDEYLEETLKYLRKKRITTYEY